jgi:hypothetical protein
VAMPRMSRHGLRWRIRRGRIASLAQGQERSTWAAADGKTSMRYAYGAIGVVAVAAIVFAGCWGIATGKGQTKFKVPQLRQLQI